MSGFILSPAAQADIESIWDYTVERWDQAQAISYARKIEQAILALVSGDMSGRSLSHVREGYRGAPAGSHLICYKVLPDGVIEIIRVLHRRMDIERRLDEI